VAGGDEPVRRLTNAPGFTATALATLAICLGANLAIYAVVDAVLVRPFPEADRLISELRNNGVPKNSYIAGPEGHGMKHFADRVDRYSRIEAFLAESLAP